MTLRKNAHPSANPDATVSGRQLWHITLPVLIAFIAASLAFWAVWREIDRRHHERVEERLDFEASDLTLKVEQRMRAYR